MTSTALSQSGVIKIAAFSVYVTLGSRESVPHVFHDIDQFPWWMELKHFLNQESLVPQRQ